MNATLLLDQKQAALDLFQRVHGADASLASEYPLIFRDGFDGRIVALGDEVLRSACAALPRTFVLGGRTVPGGLIGSVSTDPDFRGKGLATEVLIRAEAELAHAGCVFALLWADDPTFYLSRGYNAIGNEADFRLDPGCAAGLPRSSGVRRYAAADAAAVHALYETHATRLARTPEETAALLDCPKMETLVIEREGIVVAYACCGRGRDLRDTIHEWGGETSLVLALVGAHLERRFGAGMSDAHGSLYLMSPSSETKLHAALQAAGATRADGILALGRILDPAAAATLLAGCLGAQASVTVAQEPQGPLFHVRGPADEGDLDEGALLALLFGTKEVRPQVQGFLERFGFADARLPLEPFAWGLDSI